MSCAQRGSPRSYGKDENMTKRNQSMDKDLSPEDVQAVIREIKRKAEEEFQEKLKHMTPEEREEALEWAKYMS